MKKLLFVLIIAAGAGYGLMGYHFILFDNNLKILKKSNVKIANTFLDARGAKKFELALKPDLISAGISDVLIQIEGSIEESTK